VSVSQNVLLLAPIMTPVKHLPTVNAVQVTLNITEFAFHIAQKDA
jgi:hypothetical protein